MFLRKNNPSELTRADLEFLSKFRNGFKEDKYTQENWNPVLKENVGKTISNFEKNNLIQKANLEQKVEYSCKVTDLKTFLKSKGEKVSGNKDELAQRASSFRNDKFIKDIEKQNIFTLSVTGNEKVTNYLQFKENERNEAERKVIMFLESKEFKQACLTMAEYEQKQVFARGMGIDWNRYDPKDDIIGLQKIFNNPPKILKEMSSDKLKIIQIAAAMVYLFGTSDYNKYLPEGFETGIHLDGFWAANTLSLCGYREKSLDNYRAHPDLFAGVQVLSSREGCEACNKINGITFKFNEVPELPYENCTDKRGCRCTYIPITILGSLK
jgi:hypothetical protein